MIGTQVTYHHPDGTDRPAAISAVGKDKSFSVIVFAVPYNVEVANVHEGKTGGCFEFIKASSAPKKAAAKKSSSAPKNIK